MKTLYLNGLMMNRCGTFLEQLARRFQVAAPGLAASLPDADLHVVDSRTVAGSPTPEQLQQHARRVASEAQTLAAVMSEDLAAAGLSCGPEWRLPPDVVRSRLVPRVSHVLGLELEFRNFVARHPVDLVISGSDYGSHSRIITLVARELGIPTLNLEHGFFFSRFDQDRVDARSVLPTVFVSDFVNLDNELEKEGFAREAAARPVPASTFLALGTPMRTVAATGPASDDAAAALGLEPSDRRVLVLGSWIESRSVNSVIQGQLDTMAAYEDLLASLAASEMGPQVQLLIKLHPVDASPEVFPRVRAALLDMAAEHGLPRPEVFADRLPELLSAADVVVSMGFSSVLFEAFQLGKPAVVRVLPFLAPSRRSGWQKDINVPLREGVMTAVESGSEVWDEVAACLQPRHRQELAAARERLCRTYGLDFPSVETKSARIIDWIEKLLEDRAPSPS